MNSSSSIIAAFDFDHTLIDRDSLLSFLIYQNGLMKTGLGLTRLMTSFGRYLTKNLSRQEIKEKILTAFLQGSSIDEIREHGKQFANHRLDLFLKQEAYQRLKWHQSQHHRCLLVSASPDFYLIPWAKRHGFETVLASQLQLTPTGHITGRLVGLNCWGAEKKRRLLEYLGSKEHYQLYVYGDSQGDQELLQFADFPFYRRFS